MHRQRLTEADDPRPCAECGKLLATGDEVTLDQGESFCSGECAYHHATGGKLTLAEEIEAERFARPAPAPYDYDCLWCGRPFVPNRNGASSYDCADCVKRSTPAVPTVNLRFPYKLEGDRILVDADALEADKNNEDQ